MRTDQISLGDHIDGEIINVQTQTGTNSQKRKHTTITEIKF
jgi:hypothetical protein